MENTKDRERWIEAQHKLADIEQTLATITGEQCGIYENIAIFHTRLLNAQTKTARRAAEIVLSTMRHYEDEEISGTMRVALKCIAENILREFGISRVKAPSEQEVEDYENGVFPDNDELYCPDCSGMKTRAGREWHTWNCPRADKTEVR